MKERIFNKYFPELEKSLKNKFFKLYKIHKLKKKKNIISNNCLDFFYERHILHSLCVYKICYFFKKSIIIDVGTGGGFPGIPLALLLNKTKFILIDSIKKKNKIINLIIKELHLKNVYVKCTRIENLHNKCNFIIGRAVTNLPKFIRLVKKKLFKKKNKINNGILYLKGGEFENEKNNQYLYIDYSIYNFFKEKCFLIKKLLIFLLFNIYYMKIHKKHNSFKKSNEIYTSKNIKYLYGIEHVRLRPSMYIGDIGIKGFQHMVYEVINNSIDESLSGFCDKIYVTIHKDNSITVLDNGRGIPVELHEKEGISALELVMTKIGAGGKFDNNSYKFSGGLHGVGISCVNALSSKLIAKIFRNGKIYLQKYSRGVPISKLEIIGDSKNQRGTKITFKADKFIKKKKSYNYSLLKKRLRELSFLNKGLSISLLDERIIYKNVFLKKNHFSFSKKGIKDFLMFIEKNKKSIIENYKSKNYRIKDFFLYKKK